MSGHEYCLQTAHLESWRHGHFAPKPANPPSYKVGKAVIILIQPYCTLAFTWTHDCPIPLVYTGRKLLEIEE